MIFNVTKLIIPEILHVFFINKGLALYFLYTNITRNNKNMTITNEKVVSIIYNLRVSDNEEIIESINKDNPLKFIPGRGSLLQSFENHLLGMTTGGKFNFTLNYEDAYGPVNEQAIMNLPISIFKQEGEDDSFLYEGAVIPMRDKDGHRFNGKVVSISDSEVKMDFNHPMAGRNLLFEGEVIEVRDATEEELQYGLKTGGCSGCSGSCGDGACSPADCEDENCGEGACGCGC